MTPLELSILLHYKASAVDFRDGDFSAPAVRQCINDFTGELQMLESTGGDPDKSAAYRLTERGRVYVEALCCVPYPQLTWYVPGMDVKYQPEVMA